MQHILVAKIDIGGAPRGFTVYAIQYFSVDTWIKDLACLEQVTFKVWDHMKKCWTTEFGEPDSRIKELLSSQLVNQALAISASEWGV